VPRKTVQEREKENCSRNGSSEILRPNGQQPSLVGYEIGRCSLRRKKCIFNGDEHCNGKETDDSSSNAVRKFPWHKKLFECATRWRLDGWRIEIEMHRNFGLPACARRYTFPAFAAKLVSVSKFVPTFSAIHTHHSHQNHKEQPSRRSENYAVRRACFISIRSFASRSPSRMRSSYVPFMRALSH